MSKKQVSQVTSGSGSTRRIDRGRQITRASQGLAIADAALGASMMIPRPSVHIKGIPPGVYVEGFDRGRQIRPGVFAYPVERWIRSDSAVDDTVPELGQKLLPFLLPRKLRDAAAGDLEEDFKIYLAKFGRTYAVRLYWWDVGSLCVSRLRPTAIVTALAFWLRRATGF
jgi:hypothetical protein